MSMEFSNKNFTLGVLGGGQLGRMLIQEAVNLNISVAIMDPDENAPCRFLCEKFVQGDLMSEAAVLDFGKHVNVLTVEIEHVNTAALLQLEAAGVSVYPQPLVLQMVQDKGLQKEFYRSHKIPTADFVLLQNKEELRKYSDRFPAMLKLRKGGYDGKGVMKIKSEVDVARAFDAPCVLEKLIPFEKEISVIVARNHSGEIVHYPPVEMDFNPHANLVEFLYSPARINSEIELEAIRIARLVIEKTAMVGLLAVEMFVTKEGTVLVNEIAPRPHNSGHQTIEGNSTSQYAQHLRAILNLPLGDTAIIQPSVMLNLLGEQGYTGDAKYEGIEEAMKIPGVYIHLYGKKMTKPFRKMGHITVTDSRIEGAIEKAKKVQQLVKVISN